MTEKQRTSSARLIHISGSPGSGKSALGHRLKKEWEASMFPLVWIVETDEFIQPHTQGGKELLALQKRSVSDSEYERAWKRITEEQLDAVVKKAEQEYVGVVIFVGIMNNMSHHPDLIYPLDERYHLVRKFFLNPGDEVTWTQFCQREMAHPLPEKSAFMRDNQLEQAWHERHGYTVVHDPETIFTSINDFIE